MSLLHGFYVKAREAGSTCPILCAVNISGSPSEPIFQQLHSRRTHDCHQLAFSDHTVHIRDDRLSLLRSPVSGLDCDSCPQQASNVVMSEVITVSVLRLTQKAGHFENAAYFYFLTIKPCSRGVRSEGGGRLSYNKD